MKICTIGKAFKALLIVGLTISSLHNYLHAESNKSRPETLKTDTKLRKLEKISLNKEVIDELNDYQIGYRSNLAPIEIKNESTAIKIPRPKIQPKIGVLNTELIYQPWDKTYQLGGSLDLIEITKKRKQEEKLLKQCGFNFTKCPELSPKSLEEEAVSAVSDVLSRLKETTKEVYRVTKDQLSVSDEN